MVSIIELLLKVYGKLFYRFPGKRGLQRAEIQCTRRISTETGSGGLIVQTWQQKLPQWNSRETDFIVNQELRDINEKEKK